MMCFRRIMFRQHHVARTTGGRGGRLDAVCRFGKIAPVNALRVAEAPLRRRFR